MPVCEKIYLFMLELFFYTLLLLPFIIVVHSAFFVHFLLKQRFFTIIYFVDYESVFFFRKMRCK